MNYIIWIIVSCTFCKIFSRFKSFRILVAHVESQCDPNRLYSCQQNFQNLTGIDLKSNWRQIRNLIQHTYSGANDTGYRKMCRHVFLLNEIFQARKIFLAIHKTCRSVKLDNRCQNFHTCQYFRGFREFGECMDGNYYQCVNIPYLVQNVSDTLEDAYHILKNYLQAHFVCGAGFEGISTTGQLTFRK